MSAYLDHIVFIMYMPQDVVNVAGVVRVMSNFGLPHLRLVEPAAFDPYRIEGIAHGTATLVANARRFPTLADASADCTLVLGTTGRPREAERQVLTPREASPLLLGLGAEPAAPHVAVVFGPEQDGLPNAALDLCHGVITIPTHPDNRSLNLAQAALVIAYELWSLASAEQPLTPTEPDLAGGEQRESLFSAVEALLRALYPNTTDVRLEASLSRLRTVLMRARPRTEEATSLTNLFTHAARALTRR